MSYRALKILKLTTEWSTEYDSIQLPNEIFTENDVNNMPVILEDSASLLLPDSNVLGVSNSQNELLTPHRPSEIDNSASTAINEECLESDNIMTFNDLPSTSVASDPTLEVLQVTLSQIEVMAENDLDPMSFSQEFLDSETLGNITIDSPDRIINTDMTSQTQNPDVRVEEMPKTENEHVIVEPAYGNMEEGRKRKKKADKSTWKKFSSEMLREKGKAYLGYTRGKDGKVRQDVVRPERNMGETCNSNFCIKSSKRQCQSFSDAERRDIFERFWGLLNWDQRKIFVCTNVTRSVTKRKTTAGNEMSRREGTLHYSLNENDEKVEVCRKFFLSTLGLRPFTVQSWVKKSAYGMEEEKKQVNKKLRDRNSRVKRFSKAKEELNKFLDELPKQPSHYVRRSSNKLYLEQHFTSFKQLYQTYVQNCKDNGSTALERWAFMQGFNEKNLSLFTPKKDQCDICIGHEAGNVSEEKYMKHIEKKNKVRIEKESDIEKAKDGTCIVITMDLQAVKVAPYLNATSIYFKTKLSCHSFTIYDCVSHKVSCYWFTEIDSNLNASTFISCLLHYLELNCLSSGLPIIIYSDGCTFQNRNCVLANALLNFSILHNINITQKYLEKGPHKWRLIQCIVALKEN